MTKKVAEFSHAEVGKAVQNYCIFGLSNKVELIESYKKFRQVHFKESKETSMNRLYQTIKTNIPTILKEALQERKGQYEIYVASYKKSLGFVPSGYAEKQKNNYKTLYQMVMKGNLPLLKSFWSMHDTEQIVKFSSQSNFENPDRFKGLSYPEFARIISASGLKDVDIVEKIRCILTFDDVEIDNCLFLPALVLTLFFAEVSRFPRSHISTLMMLDLIQSDSKDYNWESCLCNRQCEDARNEFNEADIKSANMFEQFLPYKKVQERFPMSNLDSARVTTNQKFTDRIEHQKEVAILIDWLALLLNEKIPNLTVEVSRNYIPLSQPTFDNSHFAQRIKECFINMIKTRMASVANYTDIGEFNDNIRDLTRLFS